MFSSIIALCNNDFRVSIRTTMKLQTSVAHWKSVCMRREALVITPRFFKNNDGIHRYALNMHVSKMFFELQKHFLEKYSFWKMFFWFVFGILENSFWLPFFCASDPPARDARLNFNVLWIHLMILENVFSISNVWIIQRETARPWQQQRAANSTWLAG